MSIVSILEPVYHELLQMKNISSQDKDRLSDCLEEINEIISKYQRGPSRRRKFGGEDQYDHDDDFKERMSDVYRWLNQDKDEEREDFFHTRERASRYGLEQEYDEFIQLSKEIRKMGVDKVKRSQPQLFAKWFQMLEDLAVKIFSHVKFGNIIKTGSATAGLYTYAEEFLGKERAENFMESVKKQALQLTKSKGLKARLGFGYEKSRRF